MSRQMNRQVYNAWRESVQAPARKPDANTDTIGNVENETPLTRDSGETAPDIVIGRFITIERKLLLEWRTRLTSGKQL